MNGQTSDTLKTRFVAPNAVAGYPEEALGLLWEHYLHEKNYRSRILAAAPGSQERSRLMREMYEVTWANLDRLDALNRSTTPYHSRRADRTKDVASLLRLLKPGRAIEIGAGGGTLCAALAQAGWSVDGVDVVSGRDWDAISRELGVQFHVGDLTTIELPSNAYDLCVMDNTLEHIPPGDYDDTIRRVLGLLRPGGWFVAVVPNRLTGPHDVSRYFVRRGGAAEGSHFNERRFSELASDLKRLGFLRVTTVAYAALASGRRLGWSRLWYWKARLAELFFAGLPAPLRPVTLFTYMVPVVVAARKR